METMQIRWLGHSCFAITCQEYTVVVDPFAPGSVPGYADIQETADQVLCSHEHHDHNYRAGVTLRLFTTIAAGRSGAPTPSTCWRPEACGWPIWGIWALCLPQRWWSSCKTWTRCWCR